MRIAAPKKQGKPKAKAKGRAAAKSAAKLGPEDEDSGDEEEDAEGDDEEEDAEGGDEDGGDEDDKEKVHHSVNFSLQHKIKEFQKHVEKLQKKDRIIFSHIAVKLH